MCIKSQRQFFSGPDGVDNSGERETVTTSATRLDAITLPARIIQKKTINTSYHDDDVSSSNLTVL